MTTDPDFDFCGFSLWIDRRQFPDASDYWDGNWLMIRAQMDASDASVKCAGPIMMTADIKRFRDELARMDNTLTGEATLMGLELELKLLLKLDNLGHVKGKIEITPNHLNQRDSFNVEADQTCLPALVQSCDAMLARFPVISADDKR